MPKSFEHATKIVGTIDEEDPASLARAREVPAPLDVYREQNRRSGGGAGGDGGRGGPASGA